MYQEQLSSSKPGLIIIMIDQSGSMSDSYAGSTKAKFATLAVNRVIAEIITACTVGDEIRDRCYVAVIGYGDGVNVMFLDKVSDLAKNPNTITVKKKVSDGAGGLVEVDEIVRVFVNDTASGATPMTEAFQQAYKGVDKFISNNPSGFPPIVINITDGEPNNIDTAATEANKLAQLKTSDGNAIIMNAHISTASAGKIELSSNNAGFSGNKFANFLFDISTVLPDTLANRAKETGFNVESGSRGFVFNADAETLIRILNFGSLGALR
jgi:von Willebrand factor type A domain